MTLTLRATLEVEFASDAEARRIRDALDVDSEGYTVLSVSGRRLEAEAVGDAGTVWNAMDDLLACLSVAMGVEETTDALDETAKYE